MLDKRLAMESGVKIGIRGAAKPSKKSFRNVFLLQSNAKITMSATVASQAPLDHVRSRHSKIEDELKKQINFVRFCSACFQDKKANGRINNKYAAKTLGFSKTETTLPLMSQK